jgi:hypothetical protein
MKNRCFNMPIPDSFGTEQKFRQGGETGKDKPISVRSRFVVKFCNPKMEKKE